MTVVALARLSRAHTRAASHELHLATFRRDANDVASLVPRRIGTLATCVPRAPPRRSPIDELLFACSLPEWPHRVRTKQDCAQINPRMWIGFWPEIAFLRPPRLTLNVSVSPQTKPSRVMLGGGAEKGERGAIGAQVRLIVSNPHTRVKLRCCANDFRLLHCTDRRHTRARAVLRVPMIGPDKATSSATIFTAGAPCARDFEAADVLRARGPKTDIGSTRQ